MVAKKFSQVFNKLNNLKEAVITIFGGSVRYKKSHMVGEGKDSNFGAKQLV